MMLLAAFLSVAVLQSTVFHYLGPGRMHPDLFLLLLFFTSLSGEADIAALLGFLFGLYQDALSGGPLGMKAFTLSLMGYLTARFSQKLYTPAILPRFVLLLFIALLSGLTNLTLLNFFLAFGPPLPTFLGIALPEALSTAALGLLILLFLRMRRSLEVRL